MHKHTFTLIFLTLFSLIQGDGSKLNTLGKSALLTKHKQIKATDVPLQTSFKIDSDWETGYTAYITITNNSNNTISSWRTTMSLNSGQTIDSVWSSKLISTQNNVITIANESWNNAIAPQQSVSFGYQVSNPQKSAAKPAQLSAIGSTSSSAPDASFALGATYVIDNQWPTGYQATVTLKNSSSSPSTSWQASFVLPTGHTVSNYWNVVITKNGDIITASNPLWTGGGVIPAQGSTTFGMIINKPLNSTNSINQLQAVANGTTNPGPQVPQAPVLNQISVNPSSPRDYTISWNSVSGATSYKLQEDTHSDFSQAKTITEGSALSYQITNKTDGTYYYRVSASNATGSSSFSNVQQIIVTTTPISLAAPVVQAINNPSGARQFQISWNSVTNAQGYTLQQSTSSNNSGFTTIFSGNSTSAQVTVTSAGTYYYRVLAFAASVTSAPSNVVNTTVTEVPSPSKFIIDSYWESWNSQDPINDIVNMHVDVINISFANFKTTGTHTFEISGIESDLATIQQLVTTAHSLGKRVKIAIGGATYPLEPQLKTAQDAVGMAQAVAKYVNDHNLDGVDYDIEDYPAADLQIALLQNSRQLLPNKLITYTPKSPASSTYPYDQVIKNGHQYIDYLSIMAYDYAPGYRYQDDVQALLAAAVPASKIVVGLMPGWDDVGVRTTVADITTAAQFIKQKNLAGIMFWDLNRDYENVTGLGKNAATTAAWNVFHS